MRIGCSVPGYSGYDSIRSKAVSARTRSSSSSRSRRDSSSAAGMPVLALLLAGNAPVLRRDALHDHLDVLARRAGGLFESRGHRLDDLRHGLLGDALVVELDFD